MIDKIKDLAEEIKTSINSIDTAGKLEEFRLKHLVKKGTIQAHFDELKTLSKELKPIAGKELNQLREFAQNAYNSLLEKFSQNQSTELDIDLTLPGKSSFIGRFHPVRQILDEMVEIFISMGFSVAEGPDIEDMYHNFDALNFPPEHPARDMQDTFFITSERGDLLLRTHTSPVQIRIMENQMAPIRTIMPGRVYRNEAISARSLAEFHQIEGLYIDKDVSFAELKGTMIVFAQKMYGFDSKFRFRPSFFPFTEPSAEMDITCFLCKGKGCRVCKYSGWLEIAGCGLVHPNVLKNCGIEPEDYSGYAFGFGIERVAMLRTGIDDIRLFYDNDIRVLKQF